MLFDIHCHILPAIDDGSKSMEETEKITKAQKKCFGWPEKKE